MTLPSPYDAPIPPDAIFLGEGGDDANAEGQPPPQPQLPIFAGMRLSEVTQLVCQLKPHAALGNVYEIALQIHPSSRFRRGASYMDKNQGVWRLWCNVPHGRYHAARIAYPSAFSEYAREPGDSDWHYSPVLGVIPYPDNVALNTFNIFWKPPPDFSGQPEFVLDCWSLIAGVNTYEANWVDDGARPAAFRRLVPHSGNPQKRILVLGPR